MLFAAEGGSRAWGMESRDSDYDVRFVYVHPPEEYLAVTHPCEAIEETHEEIDMAGWDTRKTLHLLRKGNVAIYEWLRSPEIYVETPWSKLLRVVALQYFQPKACIFHYFGLAHRNYKAYIANKDPVNTKKYLYVLRSIMCCRWAEVKGTPPPVGFGMMMNLLNRNLPQPVIEETFRLIARKMAGEEMKHETPLILLNTYIEGELKRFKELATGMTPDEKPDLDILKLLMLSAVGTEAMITR